LCFTLNFVAAQCTTELGLLSSSNFQKNESVFVCYEDTLKVELSDYQLMEGQELYYVYHFDKDYTLGHFKIDTAETEGMINSYRDEIFVTAIITNSNSLFEIDDSCAVFSNTIEVNFLEELRFELDYECRYGSPNDYIDIYYQAWGGLPGADSTFSYVVSGDISDTLKLKQIDSLRITPPESMLYIVNVYDGPCSANEALYVQWCFQLPIELLTLTGEVINKTHLIKWVTPYEVENSHFIIDVSKDAVNFELVDTVKGFGTTSKPMRYSLTNNNVSPGVYYYRIRKVNFDEKIEMLGIIEVIQYATSVYPNPTKQYLNLHNNGQVFQNLEINITDITGQQIANYTQNQIETSNLGYRLNVDFLSSGIYFMNVMADDFQKIEKFVVEK